MSEQTAQQPIGIFDSGRGGLTVLTEIRKRLPQENLIYIADTEHAPYGTKPAEFVLERCHWMVEQLLQQHAKAIVMACNTATSYAIAQLRSRYPSLPFVGMEPPVKPAIALSKTGIVGVLATPLTLSSEKYKQLLANHQGATTVVSRACYGWVELVESGDLKSAEAKALVQHHLEPVLDAGADTLALGCTHYPLLSQLIRSVAESLGHPGIDLVAAGEAVAQRLHDVAPVTSQRGVGTTAYFNLQNGLLQPWEPPAFS